jgi:hypothetical protein
LEFNRFAVVVEQKYATSKLTRRAYCDICSERAIRLSPFKDFIQRRLNQVDHKKAASTHAVPYFSLLHVRDHLGRRIHEYGLSAFGHDGANSN